MSTASHISNVQSRFEIPLAQDRSFIMCVHRIQSNGHTLKRISDIGFSDLSHTLTPQCSRERWARACQKTRPAQCSRIFAINLTRFLFSISYFSIFSLPSTSRVCLSNIGWNGEQQIYSGEKIIITYIFIYYVCFTTRRNVLSPLFKNFVLYFFYCLYFSDYLSSV